jgi:PAS domain S-box-containing protein
LEPDPTTKRVLKEGYKSFLVLPVRLKGRIVATVSLVGREGLYFSPKQHDLLTQLPIGKAVAMALYLRERNEVDFFHKLIQQIGKCDDGTPPSAEGVAGILATELSRFYEWQNVSIFKVNDVHGRFELVAQGKGPQKGFRLRKRYRQDIDRGILGEVYRSGEPIIAPDVRDGKYANIYVASRKGTKSELCVPIKIHGKIVWLLNLEDCRFRAFCQEDQKTLDRIIHEVEFFLESLFTRTTLEEVLEVSHDGIVVTDLEGRIQSINPAAARMLKLTATDARDRSFSDFVDDPSTKEVIRSQNPINAGTQKLVDARGAPLKTRMSSRDLPTEYGGRVFFLEDLKHVERLENREATQGALYEIATQTRMPLSLASSLLRKLERSAEEVQRELVGKALRQLSKAEVIFERLMLYGDASIPHHRTNAIVDIRELLDYVREQLPAADAEAVRAQGLDGVPAVNGDVYQLTFVLQSLVNYFLGFRPADEDIVVEAIRDGSDIWISVTGVVGDDYRAKMEGDHVDPCLTARAEVALGEQVLRRFIENNHGGTYQPPCRRPDGRETARIGLPASDVTSLATGRAG